MSEGSGFHPITDAIIAKAERIEDEKHGKALTKDEVTTLRARDALRLLAPYAFAPSVDIQRDEPES
jgi:hypothetical protein